jgi:XapX domain-containing protein
MHIILLFFLSLFVGFILGGVFTLLKLPLPAPTTFAGVLGVVGVWLGYELVKVMI